MLKSLLLAAFLISTVSAQEPKTAAEYLARGKATLAAAREHDDEAPVERAIKDFDKAVELDPKSLEGYKARADAVGHLLGDWDGAAIADLDAAIKLAPKDADAYLERGRWKMISEKDGSKNGALADCKKAAALAPKNPSVYACQAEAHVWLGERVYAEAAYAKAVALSPRDARLLEKRAVNLLRTGRLKEALVQCDASLAIDPDDCRLYRAEILRGLGRDAEAQRDQQAGERKAMDVILNTGTPAERKLIKDVLGK